MTNLVGDLPMTEALKGLDTPNPKYDSQKDIYLQIIKWLDEANADLAGLIAAGNKTLDGDIYFNNDLSKWQKAVNTFQLRVLISLSKKEGDADLKIKQQFAAIMADKTKYPVMGTAWR